MIMKIMYRYEREEGRVTVSFSKPIDRPYTEIYRLIADEGKVVTNDGVNTFICVDVNDHAGYYEIEKVETEGTKNE